jgi:hypothetical protein
MHQAELRTWTRSAFTKPFRRGDHGLQALAINRPGSDLPTFAQDVDAVYGWLAAVATDQLQKRLRQTRMIDGEPLIEEVIAELRQRLPIPVSNFQLQQPHAAFIGTKSFPLVNEAEPPPRRTGVDDAEGGDDQRSPVRSGSSRRWLLRGSCPSG